MKECEWVQKDKVYTFLYPPKSNEDALNLLESYKKQKLIGNVTEPRKNFYIIDVREGNQTQRYSIDKEGNLFTYELNCTKTNVDIFKMIKKNI